MDRVQEKLEGLREGPAYSSEAAFVPQALRTILARQAVLISAVISMSEMLEELLAASGRPRKALLPGVEDELLPRGPEEDPTRPIEGDRLEPDEPAARPARRRKRFGDLARRRRRGALAAAATMMVLVGAWGILFSGVA